MENKGGAIAELWLLQIWGGLRGAGWVMSARKFVEMKDVRISHRGSCQWHFVVLLLVKRIRGATFLCSPLDQPH